MVAKYTVTQYHLVFISRRRNMYKHYKRSEINVKFIKLSKFNVDLMVFQFK